MLSRRLTGPVVAAVLLSSCAGVDGSERGVLRENVIEPGITAIDESKLLACGSEASSFRTALEAYEVLEGEPALDEAALLERGLMRSESDLWNIVDGRLVPQDPTCGDVPATVPAAEIVTEPGDFGTPSVADVLAAFNIVSVGGTECTRQLATVLAGSAAYAETEGREPDTLADIAAGGYFDEPVTLWEVVDDELRPAPGSDCVDFVGDGEVDEQAEACSVAARTLEVAREAYLAQFGDEPTRQDLIDAGLVPEPIPGAELVIDLVEGVPRAVPGGPCVADPADGPPRVGADCAADRRAMESAVKTFTARSGSAPSTEAELVASGLLRAEVDTFDLGDEGAVVPAPGGACTS